MLIFTVGRNINAIRRNQKMTIEHLAGAANMDTAHLGRIERAKHNATLSTLLAISQALSSPLHELFDEGYRETDYTVLENFIENNLPQNNESLPLRLQINSLGYTLLSSLTVLDIERGAVNAYNCAFALIEEARFHNTFTYGIAATFEYPTGSLTRTMKDITSDKNIIKAFVKTLNRLHPSHTAFEGALDDLMTTLYT